MKKISLIVILFFTVCLSNQTYAKKPLKKNAQYTGPAIVEYDVMFSAGGFYKILNKCENDIAKDYRYRIGFLSWQDYVNYNQGLAKYTSSIWSVDKCDKDEMKEIIEWYDQIISHIENELKAISTNKNNQTVPSKEDNYTENENHLKCAFTFSEYANDKVAYDSSSLRYFSNTKLYAEFFSSAKFNWNIKNIYFSDNLKESILFAFEKEKNLWKKMIYNQKLSQDERNYAKLILKELNYSLSELEKETKQLSKSEKKEFMSVINSRYEEELEKYLPDIDDLLKNQKTFSEEIIQMFDKYKDITVNGNKVKINFVTDGGMLVESNINYSQILKKNSINAILIKLNFTDGSFLELDSECNNKKFTLSSDQTEKEDPIESTLRKLKSLFENELITQEEYDAKRKEILDEM